MQEVHQFAAGRGHHVLSRLAQGDFDKGSGFNADIEHVGQQAEDIAEGAVGRIGSPGKNLLHTGA